MAKRRKRLTPIIDCWPNSPNHWAAIAADEADARTIATAASEAGERLVMGAGDDESARLASEFGASVVTIADDFTALHEGPAARFTRFATRA